MGSIRSPGRNGVVTEGNSFCFGGGVVKALGRGFSMVLLCRCAFSWVILFGTYCTVLWSALLCSGLLWSGLLWSALLWSSLVCSALLCLSTLRRYSFSRLPLLYFIGFCFCELLISSPFLSGLVWFGLIWSGLMPSGPVPSAPGCYSRASLQVKLLFSLY
ncbi:hypothetical protein F4861DRAFT_497886 [Xylaria intraflava]|nr:hypothetical protein F4861DRAFT_497886 [Xylaria intraflava]